MKRMGYLWIYCFLILGGTNVLAGKSWLEARTDSLRLAIRTADPEQRYAMELEYLRMYGLFDRHRSISHAESLKTHYEAQEDLRGLCYVELALGKYYTHRASFGSGFTSLLHSLALSRRINEPYVELRSYLELAHLFRSLPDPERSEYYLQQGIERAEAAKDTLMKGRMLISLAGIFRKGKTLSRSFDYILWAIEVLSPTKEYEDIAAAQLKLNRIYMEMHQNEKAWENCQLARELARKSGNPYLISLAYNDLAWLSRMKGEYRQSEEFNLKALEYREQYGDPEPIASSMRNIADLHMHFGHLEKARKWFMKAATILDTLGSENAIGFKYTLDKNLADLYGKLGQYEKQIQHLNAYWKQKFDYTAKLRDTQFLEMRAINEIETSQDRKKLEDMLDSLRYQVIELKRDKDEFYASTVLIVGFLLAALVFVIIMLLRGQGNCR